jgi:hypothetical protein
VIEESSEKYWKIFESADRLDYSKFQTKYRKVISEILLSLLVAFLLLFKLNEFNTRMFNLTICNDKTQTICKFSHQHQVGLPNDEQQMKM